MLPAVSAHHICLKAPEFGQPKEHPAVQVLSAGGALWHGHDQGADGVPATAA